MFLSENVLGYLQGTWELGSHEIREHTGKPSFCHFHSLIYRYIGRNVKKCLTGSHEVKTLPHTAVSIALHQACISVCFSPLTSDISLVMCKQRAACLHKWCCLSDSVLVRTKLKIALLF